MENKEYRLKDLNDVIKLGDKEEIDTKTKLLELFTTYVYMTNPDYKYNETYLKDMILGFWSNIKKYNRKILLGGKLLNEIQKHIIPDSIRCQLSILIDETWELRFDNISEKSKGVWEKTISEIRLVDAINRKLLSPFHYFGVTDSEDLSHLKWARGGYDISNVEWFFIPKLIYYITLLYRGTVPIGDLALAQEHC